MPQGRDGRETKYRNSSHDDRRQSSRQSSRDDGYRNERHKEPSSRDDHYSGDGGGKATVSERRSETDFFRDRAPRDDQQRNGEKSRSSKDWSAEDRVPNHKQEEATAVDRSKEGQRYQENVEERPRSTEKKHQHWGSDEEVEELAEKIDLETKEPCWNQQSTASSYPSRANYSNPQGHQSYGRAAKDGNKARELDVFIVIFNSWISLCLFVCVCVPTSNCL